ncbi:hypothetical protein [Novisyntrophococcus fermenticellae]|uniref:hypothetical protein n=1 Tax=Novisyntrophococcus fermenticellae TaxID=2068655 RepID=UPI001E2B28F3|nr:hypothetical protein [Novisyntrophococcus fermenticellae]
MRSFQLRNKSIRIFFFALIFYAASVIIVQASPIDNSRTQDGVKVEISYGLKGLVRAGNRFPIYLKLTNQGADFEGTITLQSATQDYSNTAMTYVINSLLPATFGGTHNQIVNMEVPVSLKAGETWKRPIVSFFQYNTEKYQIILKNLAGEVVYEETLKINQSNILSVEYLIGVMSEDTQYSGLLGQFPWAYDQILDGSFVRNVLLTPEDLTIENLAVGIPDVLIFADYQPGDLSVSQQTALKTWEQQGGILITGADKKNVTELLTAALSKSDVNQIIYRSAGDAAGHDYSVLQDMPIKEQPNLVFYAVLLLIYALIAGPGLYLLLKRFHKRYYLWGGMTCLSLGAVALIGICGSGTRIRAPFLTYLNVMEQQEDSWSESIDLGLQAPYSSSSNLYIDSSYTIIPWSSESSENPENFVDTSTFGKVALSYKGDKKKITVSDLPPFSMTRYFLNKEHILDENQGLSASIHVFDGKAEGRVTNLTDFDFKNAVVIMPATGIRIGDIAAGETIEVKDKKVENLEEMGMESSLLKREGKAGKDTFETQVWGGFLNMRNITRRSESLIMAQVVNPDTSWQSDSGYETYGYAFYYAPAEVNMTKGDLLYCPYAEQYRSDDTITYIPGQAFRYLYLYESEYTVTFHLNDILEDSGDTDLEIQSLWFKPFELQDKYTLPFQGSIDFYNYETREFDQMKEWNRRFNEEELKEYLNSANEITLRYRIKDVELDETKTYLLPGVHVIGKAGIDAEN